MQDGWIKLHRKFVNWEWIDDTKTLWVFIKCLMLANFEDKKWHGIELKRGSFVTSYENLSSKKAGVSVRGVRTALNHLKTTGELTIKTTNKYTVISINNYDLYQSDDKQTALNRQATDRQPTTTKEYKNIRNKEIYTPPTPSKGSVVVSSIAKEMRVSEYDVEQTLAQMEDWLRSKGKTYKDKSAALRNWLRKRINSKEIKQYQDQKPVGIGALLAQKEAQYDH